MCARARSVGAFAILEHPAKAEWLPTHPSSWTVLEIAKLLDLGHASAILLDQCTCGAEYKKPTQLLEVNIPQLRTHVRQLPNAGLCPHRRHGKVLIGEGPDGRFLTAPAKEYPPLFSKTIALAILGLTSQTLLMQNAPIVP